MFLVDRKGEGKFENLDVRFLVSSFFSLQDIQLECERKCSASMALSLEERSKSILLSFPYLSNATGLHNLNAVGVRGGSRAGLERSLHSPFHVKSFLALLFIIGRIAV